MLSGLAPGEPVVTDGAILLDVEPGEMVADDLVRRISLDPLGAGVPIGDDAVRIEHVERMVGDAIDEQAEAALAFAERLLRKASKCHPLLKSFI